MEYELKKVKSQKPLIGSYSNFKLKLRWTNYIVQIFKWRRPSNEEDLKVLKVENLSNRLLDHNQTLNLSLDDQTILSKSLKWRRPSTEDDLKILKVENHDLWIIRGKLEENSEEISRVALLSPAC
jgi:hypothetical protein